MNVPMCHIMQVSELLIYYCALLIMS